MSFFNLVHLSKKISVDGDETEPLYITKSEIPNYYSMISSTLLPISLYFSTFEFGQM